MSSPHYLVPTLDTVVSVAALSTAFVLPEDLRQHFLSSHYDASTSSSSVEGPYTIDVSEFDYLMKDENDCGGAVSCALSSNATSAGGAAFPSWAFWMERLDPDDPLACVFKGSCSSRALFWTAVTLYVGCKVVYLILAFYRFVMVWNFIIKCRRMDLPAFRPHFHKSAVVRCCNLTFCYDHERLQTVHRTEMKDHMSCPICLVDFYEGDFVTPCEDGCGMWFHKSCLFEWLDRRDTCPCCRLDMFHPDQQQHSTKWLSFLGIRSHTRR